MVKIIYECKYCPIRKKKSYYCYHKKEKINIHDKMCSYGLWQRLFRALEHYSVSSEARYVAYDISIKLKDKKPYPAALYNYDDAYGLFNLMNHNNIQYPIKIYSRIIDDIVYIVKNESDKPADTNKTYYTIHELELLSKKYSKPFDNYIIKAILFTKKIIKNSTIIEVK